eukprot:TRINITY_DN10996_c0_g1_i1.p1 TRINITY_DN10996_c0_g1~~TRINITY_DN10996_c0_g1_i1.p1  ORF type:complete len:296 (-),score=62.95 TRINITY_DN10996_c0_g1_i1:245-1132(-)
MKRKRLVNDDPVIEDIRSNRFGLDDVQFGVLLRTCNDPTLFFSLSEALKINTTLKSISFANCFLKRENVKQLCSVIACNSTLTAIDLDECIAPDIDLLVPSIIQNTTLTCLSVTGSTFYDTSMEILEILGSCRKSLKIYLKDVHQILWLNKKLLPLRKSFESPIDRVVQYLNDSHDTAIRLNLRYLSQEDITIILNAVKQNPFIHTIVFQELHKDLYLLDDLLSKKRITFLCMSCCNIDDQIVSQIGIILQQNYSLTDISLAENNIQFLGEFAKALEINTTLLYLNLTNWRSGNC